MTAIDPAALIAAQNRRYATKKFDPQRLISAEIWETLEEALRLSPSSFGLQPWKFIVVENPALREALKPKSWNQNQVVDAARLVVFAVKHPLSAADVDRFVARMAEVHGTPVESHAGYGKVVAGFLENPPYPLDRREWAIRQVYIALGNFMTSAAVLGVDTCPMEGLDPAGYDEVLGLTGTGFQTVVACAAGHRAEGDLHAARTKVRYRREEVFEYRN